MIAGLQEQKCGNNFGYSAFTSFGAFWIALVGILLGNKYDIYKLTSTDLGWFLLAWMLYTTILWVASARVHLAMFLTFTTLEIGFGLAVQADQGEHRNAVAQRLGAEVGVVALDDAGAFQSAHAAQTGRCRDAGPLGQLHVGHAAVGLQVAQNAPVDPVELGSRHFVSSIGRALCQNHATRAIKLRGFAIRL